MTLQVNLLPVECMRIRERRRIGALWAAACMIVAVSLLIVQQTITLFIVQQKFELQTAQAIIAPIESSLQQIAAQQQLIHKCQQQLSLGLELEQADVPLSLIQVVSDCRGKLGDSILLDSFRMDESAGSSKSHQSARKMLTLSGSGENDDAVSTFVELLQASKAFGQVELQSSQAKSDLELSHRLFQIRCSQ